MSKKYSPPSNATIVKMVDLKEQFDIVVIGAGFSGSLTALCLQKIGYDVALIEKDSHPRFAIGESSTPVADLILRDLSDRYDLPWLRDISRYGSWQNTHPEITCGLKRGFSYYNHQAGQPFEPDSDHKNELLVAASANNKHSDTNWFRSDVDAFFVRKAQEAGVIYFENTHISDLNRSNNSWFITADRSGNKKKFGCNWLIDATGSETILKMLGVESNADEFRTNTRAIYSHFENVKSWQKWLHEKGIPSDDYPYNPDHSALHHLIDEGWLWMLRFNNDITSCGLVFNNPVKQEWNKDSKEILTEILKKYPSLQELFEGAQLAELPSNLIKTGRLQRRAERLVGDGWIAFPHTAGFVDPLHSTGIAHSLSGVERILHIFEVWIKKPDKINQHLKRYEKSIFNELNFIDLLVNGCYLAMDHFELFHTYASLYFIAAIDYEQKRINSRFDIENHQFLSANHPKIRGIVEEFYYKLNQLTKTKPVSKTEIKTYREAVVKAIEPYNIAGLLDPDTQNMYHHTAAEF